MMYVLCNVGIVPWSILLLLLLLVVSGCQYCYCWYFIKEEATTQRRCYFIYARIHILIHIRVCAVLLPLTMVLALLMALPLLLLLLLLIGVEEGAWCVYFGNC